MIENTLEMERTKIFYITDRNSESESEGKSLLCVQVEIHNSVQTTKSNLMTSVEQFYVTRTYSWIYVK